MSATAPQVIVAGSINVDLIVGVTRLPSPGETVLGDRFTRQNGGKSANQAVAASRFGATVVMLGAVGDDELGRQALDGLAAAGVDVSRCRVLAGVSSGLALIVVDAAGENQIAVASGANGQLDRDAIEAAASGLEPPPGSVCLIGFEVPDAAAAAAAQWAHRRDLTIVVNPAPARPLLPELLACHPILTPNRSEAEALSGTTGAAEAAGALQQLTGGPVVVTLGADGALLLEAGQLSHLPATPTTPVDTTGAGDALNGILAAELARGASLREALRWAMAGAALKTTVAGAQAGLPTRDAVAAYLSAV